MLRIDGHCAAVTLWAAYPAVELQGPVDMHDCCYPSGVICVLAAVTNLVGITYVCTSICSQQPAAAGMQSDQGVYGMYGASGLTIVSCLRQHC